MLIHPLAILAIFDFTELDPLLTVTVDIFLALIPVTKLTPTKDHFQYRTCLLHILLKVLIN